MDTKDIYRAKIDNLTIRGGVTPEGKPSIILGTPSAHEKDVYIVIKADGKEKLEAIVDCLSTIIQHTNTKYGDNPDNNLRREVDIFHAPML